MRKPELKKVVRLSWVRERAAEEFEELKHVPDLDPSFFTMEVMEHYIEVLIKCHADEWMVINDIEDERTF